MLLHSGYTQATSCAADQEHSIDCMYGVLDALQLSLYVKWLFLYAERSKCVCSFTAASKAPLLQRQRRLFLVPCCPFVTSYMVSVILMLLGFVLATMGKVPCPTAFVLLRVWPCSAPMQPSLRLLSPSLLSPTFPSSSALRLRTYVRVPGFHIHVA
jgi:hypothetical protein